MIDRLALFGATGDLAGRYLLPALATLMADGRLPPSFELVGAARDDLDDEGFRNLIGQRLDEHAPDADPAACRRLVGSASYRGADVTDADGVAEVVSRAGDRAVAVYLALPPAAFAPAVETLAGIGLPAGSRVALEKPFGENLEQARSLNRLLARVADEQAVFRVDHVLGMATLHNLLGARLANRLFDAVWSSEHLDAVEVVWDETLALEGRAGYYDGAGALRDVIQNHLLQILAIVAMEPPASLSERDLRDAKAAVLRAVRRPTPDEAVRDSRRARYRGYVDEPGVDPHRSTETFAELHLTIDNPRWRGTTFLLRTGKALAPRYKGVVLRFRRTAHTPVELGVLPANELHIGLDGPDTFALHLTGTAAGPPPAARPMTLTAELPSTHLPAYGHVLLDLLSGDCTLAIRGDEAELAWEIVTPFLDAWAADRVPLEEYAPGTGGPPAATPRRDR